MYHPHRKRSGSVCHRASSIFGLAFAIQWIWLGILVSTEQRQPLLVTFLPSLGRLTGTKSKRSREPTKSCNQRHQKRSSIVSCLPDGFSSTLFTTMSRTTTSVSMTGSQSKMLNLSKFLRSEEHTSELQSLRHLVCRLLLE